MFFREVLGYDVKPANAAEPEPAARKMQTQLAGLAAVKNLDELQEKLHDIADDWSLMVEPEARLRAKSHPRPFVVFLFRWFVAAESRC